MKIYCLSVTSFSDTDLGILKGVSQNNDITYGVVIQKNNANFSKEELAAYCDRYKLRYQPFVFNYQQKDLRSIFVFIKIIQSIRKINPDIIYIPTFDHIVFSLLCLLLNKRKTVIGIHDVEFHSNAEYIQFLKIARKITMFKFKHFQVFSKSQEQIFKRLYPQKKVHLVNLPLKDYGSFYSVGIKCTEKVKFLFFGNILPYKGLTILIKAINRLCKRNDLPNFELIVAGRCQNWETAYEPLIEDKSIIKRRIGFIENDEIANLFGSSDYLVLPYKDATQSGPLKIAFNYNLPVIASDLLSFSEEIKDGIDGYLFRCGDVDDLEVVLAKVLIKHEDYYDKLKIAQKEYINSIYSDSATYTSFMRLFNGIKENILN